MFKVPANIVYAAKIPPIIKQPPLKILIPFSNGSEPEAPLPESTKLPKIAPRTLMEISLVEHQIDLLPFPCTVVVRQSNTIIVLVIFFISSLVLYLSI